MTELCHHVQTGDIFLGNKVAEAWSLLFASI